jgi:hypothetical protein
MTEDSPRRPSQFLRVILIIAVLLILGGSVGVLTVSQLEESDRFCGACHMAPERTYYNRTRFAIAGAQPIEDLASAHYASGDPFRCIDCHRGDGDIPDRATALMLGASDTALYLFGGPDQTIEKMRAANPALINDSCMKCHTDALLVVGFPNHYHNKLPTANTAWQAGAELSIPPDAPANQVSIYEGAKEGGLHPVEVTLFCSDCHVAHVSTPGAEDHSFMDLRQIVYPACEKCHTEALGAPLGLSERDDSGE